MNDIERFLHSQTPRGAPPELRARILASAAARLREETALLWFRRSALASTAAVILAIALNTWVSMSLDHRLARLVGPPSLQQEAAEVAQEVEQVTDAPTRQWLYHRLAVRRSPSGGPGKYFAAFEQLVHEMQSLERNTHDETPQEDHEMGHGRTGRLNDSGSDGQRRVRLDHRFTA